MYRKHHKRFLERAALREAQKALRRSGVENFKREDVGRLRVQTFEPWLRILVILFGAASLGGAWLISQNKDANIWIVAFFIVLGSVLACIGLFGRKKTVEEVLGAIGDSAISHLLDALF